MFHKSGPCSANNANDEIWESIVSLSSCLYHCPDIYRPVHIEADHRSGPGCHAIRAASRPFSMTVAGEAHTQRQVQCRASYHIKYLSPLPHPVCYQSSILPPSVLYRTVLYIKYSPSVPTTTSRSPRASKHNHNEVFSRSESL